MGGPTPDLETIFSLINQPAIVVDSEDGRIVALNNTISGRLGEHARELAGRALSEFFRLEEPTRADDPSGHRGSLSLVHRAPLPFAAKTLSCTWHGRAAVMWLFTFGPEAAVPYLESSRCDSSSEPADQSGLTNGNASDANSSRAIEEKKDRSPWNGAVAGTEEIAGMIGRQLSGLLSPSTVLQEAVDSVGRALKVDRALVTLFGENESQGFVNYEFVADKSLSSLRPRRLSVGDSRYIKELMETERDIVKSLDEQKDDPLLQLYFESGTRSLVAVPIMIAGRKAGLIELHDGDRNRAWSPEDRKLLLTVSAHMSAALTHASLFEGIQRRSEELKGLYRISRLFSTLKDTCDIYGKLSRAIADLLGAERCVIATYNKRRNRLVAEPPGFNVAPELIKRMRFTLEGPDSATSLHARGRPFFSNDPLTDDRFDPALAREFGLSSLLAIPMRIKGELLGYIYAANKPGGFTRNDLNMLEIFAGQATETIANVRLFATVQAQAEREAVINRLLLSMQNMPDAKQAVQMIVERIGQVLDLDRCTADLFGGEDRPEFRGEWCAHGVPPISDDHEAIERSPMPHWLRLHRQPLVAADVRSHSIANGYLDVIERIKLKSIAVVPILSRGKIVGAISAQQTRAIRRWAEDDVDLLTAIAAHLGTTLENAHLIKALREANRLKDEFLATVSHELKTPLTAIRGWVELLAQTPSVISEPEVMEGIDVIRNSAISLSQLISDLLELSRIQRRSIDLDLKAGDINLAVLDSIQLVKHSAEERELELVLELENNLPTAFFDTRRIQQVIWNLLTNAIKFTPRGGKVTVRSRRIDFANVLSSAGKPMQWICLEVEDTGEGIPREFLPFVWDRFRQADGSSTRRHKGLGIGLTLVKELVEAHAGFVEAKSEGRGALFTVMIPVTAEGLQVAGYHFDESDMNA